MPNPEDLVRLRHMLEAARQAVTIVNGRARADLDSDELLSLALARLLEILGEAASKVSREFRAKHSDMPWVQMIGARNRLIHGYFDVDADIVWNIVTDDLPPLLAELESLVPEARP